MPSDNDEYGLFEGLPWREKANSYFPDDSPASDELDILKADDLELYIKLQSALPVCSVDNFIAGDDPYLPLYDEEKINAVRRLADAVRENKTNVVEIIIEEGEVSPNIRIGGSHINAHVSPMGIIWYEQAIDDLKAGREVDFSTLEKLIKLGHDPRIPKELGEGYRHSLFHEVSQKRSGERAEFDNRVLNLSLTLCNKYIPDFTLSNCFNYFSFTPPIIAASTGNTEALKIYERALQNNPRLFSINQVVQTDRPAKTGAGNIGSANMVDLAVICSSDRAFGEKFWETMEAISSYSDYYNAQGYNALCLALKLRNSEALPYVITIENVDPGKIDPYTNETYLDMAARIFFEDYNKTAGIWSNISRIPRTVVGCISSILGRGSSSMVSTDNGAFELAQRSFSNLRELHERSVGTDFNNSLDPNSSFMKYLDYEEYYVGKMGFNQEAHLSR